MDLDYTVVYSKRKTITVTVERDRSVVVRAPSDIGAEKVRALLETKKLWLYEKLKHPQKYNGDAKKKEFVSGESVLYLGRNYYLEVHKTGAESIRFDSVFAVTGADSDRVADLFRSWYVDRAREKIVPRVSYHARNIGVQFNRVIISSPKYRWGSCTPNDNLTFNWRLVKAPMSVIDYVVVHELVHLVEHNHTPEFWRMVRTQVPAYLKSKVWLKEHGEILESSF